MRETTRLWKMIPGKCVNLIQEDIPSKKISPTRADFNQAGTIHQPARGPHILEILNQAKGAQQGERIQDFERKKIGQLAQTSTRL